MSKMVKILLGRDVGQYLDDDYYGRSIIQDSISDWEEISDEDYKFLKANFHMLFKSLNADYNLSPFLIVKDNIPVIERINSIKKELDKERARQLAYEAEQEAKRADRARKRMLKKAKDERALLEELKAKYEEK